MIESKHSSLGEINKEGYLMIYNSHLKKDFLIGNKGRTVRIDITVIDENKSSKSNAYYWAAIIPPIRRGFRELGIDLDVVQTHKELRALCPHMRLHNGRGVQYLRSLDDESWTNNDWQEFIRQAIQVAAEHFNIVINDPK